ncbi:hypothetical protein C8R43DRAFT_960162 [Mycena crocata]|nr:hypothetical protein C8R43DRAFT_960162 [Mycena crocata]
MPLEASNFLKPSAFGPTLEDELDESGLFFRETVEHLTEIRLVARLHYDTVKRDYRAVLEAFESLSQHSQSHTSEPHLELALLGLINAPHAPETCLQIAQAWIQVHTMLAKEAKAVLSLKLQRQSIMQITYTFWTWLDGYCVGKIQQALESDIPEQNWIGSLTQHVQGLLEVRSPSRELKSSDFGLAAIAGSYKFKSRRTWTEVTDADITSTVIEVIAAWLNFPVTGKSRAQAWFIQAIYRECDASTLFLDTVWFAFCHLESEVFGKLAGPIPSPEVYTRLCTALQKCPLADHRTEAYVLMKKLDMMIMDYRTRELAVANTPSSSLPAEKSRPARISATKAAGPPLLLTLPNDLEQDCRMHRFLEFLLELEPLIDGFEKISEPTMMSIVEP